MLYKLIFLIYFLLDLIICGTIVKRNDIDLQTCISNFDIHKDKIIRTQDSRDMGAKYLNEIDLGSREECLRLCCETEDCDVFVFEEKVCWLVVIMTFSQGCWVLTLRKSRLRKTTPIRF